MKIETEAILLGAQDIHSNKSGKDFVKFNLVVEGEFCSFFTRKADGDKFKTAKAYTELQKTHNPAKCVVTLEIKFTEKGTYCDLRGIA